MPLKIEDINAAQGHQKLLRQWDSVKTADTAPSRIVLQAQGVRFSGNSNMAVMDTDPEFADLWALYKAVVDRKYAESEDALIAMDVDSPYITAEAKARVAQAQAQVPAQG